MDFITLEELKSFMSYTKPGTVDDAALSLAVTVGCAAVVEACGEVLATTVTERLRRSCLLGSRASALIEMTSPSATIAVADFDVDGQIVFRRDGQPVPDDFTVTYTAGTETAPAWARAAALDIARQNWRTRTRPHAPGGQGATDEPIGYLVSRQAAALMNPHLLAPAGFA